MTPPSPGGKEGKGGWRRTVPACICRPAAAALGTAVCGDGAPLACGVQAGPRPTMPPLPPTAQRASQAKTAGNLQHAANMQPHHSCTFFPRYCWDVPVLP